MQVTQQKRTLLLANKLRTGAINTSPALHRGIVQRNTALGHTPLSVSCVLRLGLITTSTPSSSPASLQDTPFPCFHKTKGIYHMVLAATYTTLLGTELKFFTDTPETSFRNTLRAEQHPRYYTEN